MSSKFLEFLTNRRRELETQKQNNVNNVYAINGAIQECEFHLQNLAELQKQEDEEKKKLEDQATETPPNEGNTNE